MFMLQRIPHTHTKSEKIIHRMGEICFANHISDRLLSRNIKDSSNLIFKKESN